MTQPLRQRSTFVYLLFCALLLPASANAGLVSEIRGGLLDHASTLVSSGREDGIDANLEIAFASSKYTLWGHPMIGGNVNKEGTNTDHVYAGLAWGGQPIGDLHLRFSVGGAYHNGELLRFNDEVRGLGSKTLYHFALDIGWKFSPRYDVGLYWQHLSNGPSSGERGANDGLDNIGIRLGYHFDQTR